jgi:2-succinyl-6-hydroxy-2,4-cyclohexadiene-1-carboxylate synthase
MAAGGERFARANRLYVDLPGHGGSSAVRVDGFNGVDEMLQTTLLSYNILNYWLVGYSLGGRIAMHYALLAAGRPGRLIVEGVIRADERCGVNRVAQRQAWAQRFRELPLADVFTDWYQQPVFPASPTLSAMRW